MRTVGKVAGTLGMALGVVWWLGGVQGCGTWCDTSGDCHGGGVCVSHRCVPLFAPSAYDAPPDVHGDDCRPDECGPVPAVPQYFCADGETLAGRTGRCLQNKAGVCEWEIATCPAEMPLCESSDECGGDEFCTVEIGDCRPAPECDLAAGCQLYDFPCHGACKPLDAPGTCDDIFCSPWQKMCEPGSHLVYDFPDCCWGRCVPNEPTD